MKLTLKLKHLHNLSEMNLVKLLNYLFIPMDAKNFRAVFAQNKIVWYASMILKKRLNGRLRIFQKINAIKLLRECNWLIKKLQLDITAVFQT